MSEAPPPIPCAICKAEMTFRKLAANNVDELWTCPHHGKVQVYPGENGKGRQRRNGPASKPLELTKSKLFEAKYSDRDKRRVRGAGFETDAQFLSWAILQLDSAKTI